MTSIGRTRPRSALLAHLARSLARSSTLVVATWCPDVGSPTHAEMLSKTGRSPTAARIQLGALTAPEVSGLLRGDATEVEVGARRLVDVTGGNAFLVTELVRLTDGRPATGPVPLPPSVHAVVAGRLADLPTPIVDALEAASVLGRKGSMAVLAEVVGRPASGLADDFGEAIRAGLLDRVDDGSFSFRHALVHQSIAERLTPTRRAQLHLAAARALQARRATDDLSVTAHHLTMAAGVYDEVRVEAQDAWRVAARRAAAVGAHGDSAAYLGEAVRAAAEPDRPRLLVELGLATMRAGRPTSALEHFSAAAQWSEEPDELAQAALGYEDAYLASNATRLSRGDPSIDILSGRSAPSRRERPPRLLSVPRWPEPTGTAATTKLPGLGWRGRRQPSSQRTWRGGCAPRSPAACSPVRPVTPWPSRSLRRTGRGRRRAPAATTSRSTPFASTCSPWSSWASWTTRTTRSTGSSASCTSRARCSTWLTPHCCVPCACSSAVSCRPAAD